MHADAQPLILLVDDEPMLRRSVRQLLRHSGYRVVTAADGEEALNLAIDHGDELAAVLSDIDMPRMDGLELRVALASMLPELPVVLMSGGTHRRDAPNLLRKPFRLATLLGRLAQVVDGSAARVARTG